MNSSCVFSEESFRSFCIDLCRNSSTPPSRNSKSVTWNDYNKLCMFFQHFFFENFPSHVFGFLRKFFLKSPKRFPSDPTDNFSNNSSGKLLKVQWYVLSIISTETHLIITPGNLQVPILPRLPPNVHQQFIHALVFKECGRNSLQPFPRILSKTFSNEFEKGFLLDFFWRFFQEFNQSFCRYFSEALVKQFHKFSLKSSPKESPR